MIKFPWQSDIEPDEKIRQAQVIKAYKNTFLSAEDGAAVLADLCAYAMIDQNTFHPDPNISNFNQGKRDVALHILQMLNINVREFLTETVIMEDF